LRKPLVWINKLNLRGPTLFIMSLR